MRILVPLGTRPEIVKLAPVVRALGERGLEVRTVATGQHHDAALTDVFFDGLGLQPHELWDLDGDEAARVGSLLTLAYRELESRPDLVLLLGDTYTVPIFCLAARRHSVPVAHVEAGLRSFNGRSLEEANRRTAAASASLHFAPTALAASFLRSEGVAADHIHVVGNPVIDALRERGVQRVPVAGRRGAVFTAHRATNVDDPTRLDRIVALACRLADELGPLTFPLHPRTRARLGESGALTRLRRRGIRLTDPLPYDEMLRCLAAARVVVTDSGGLQEEASWLGVPSVVLRHSTPRWEAVAAGVAAVVGLDAELALETAVRFAGRDEQERVAATPCPFGDGHTSERIADILCDPASRAALRLQEPNFVARRPPGVVRAVLFDLDDTLYPQSSWLDGAWNAVARAAAEHGADRRLVRRALALVAAEGSDCGRIIDRALALAAPAVPAEPLVAAFRAFEAGALEPYPGVRTALAELRALVPIGLVTDGDVEIQRRKLRALGLEPAFDAVVLSDALGREHRKPSAAPFRAALGELGVPADEAVYVGDHPGKDVVGATAAGLRTIRVLTGEHAAKPAPLAPWAIASDVFEAIELVRPLVACVARRAAETTRRAA